MEFTISYPVYVWESISKWWKNTSYLFLWDQVAFGCLILLTSSPNFLLGSSCFQTQASSRYDYFIMTFFYVEPGSLFTVLLNMVLLYIVSNHNILFGTDTREESNLLTLHDVGKTSTTSVFPEFENSKRKLKISLFTELSSIAYSHVFFHEKKTYFL